MYAVIETGGKQYRVEVGTELEVELLDASAGDTVTLDRVLLVADGDATSIGRPLVSDASVSAEVVRQQRGEKLISFKYRPKARRRVKKGHRQELHVLRIADIVVGGKSAAATLAQLESSRKTERERLEEAARRQAAEDAALAAKLAAAKPASKAKAETTKAETTKAAAGKTATTKSEPAKSEPAKTTPAKTTPAKTTPAKTTPAKTTARATKAVGPKSDAADDTKAGAAPKASGDAEPTAEAGETTDSQPATRKPRAPKKDD